MFQILKKADFDFMGKRNVLLAFSLVLVLASIAILAVRGIERGIEFKGGTELHVKFAERPDVGQIRAALTQQGISNPQVTNLGDPADHEVYIQIALSEEGQEEQQGLMGRVLDALKGDDAVVQEASGLADLNKVDAASLRRLLGTFAGVDAESARQIAEAVLARRNEVALFRSHDDLADIAGLTPEVLQQLKSSSFLGPLALRSQSYIGPAIGSEIVQKAMWAILGSLAGMLVYIWIRFELQWGLAAVVALTHDTLLVLGLFSLVGKEMTLPVVAAFLTLIGYSVNDTVVVFDRIRENLRLKGATMELASVVNLSINQTLSRTIITSGLTWVVVMALFVFGGEALSAFSFVLVAGVVVGTYSSIYIASPILVLWRQLRGKRAVSRRGSQSAARRTPRKARP